MESRYLAKKKPLAAFYEIPTGVKTSSQIIEDARRSVRLLPTSRPYTPAGGRNLFGGTSKPSGSRPPSVFSLGQLNYIEEPGLLVQPISGPKLKPIDKIPEFSSVPPTPVQSVIDVNQNSPIESTEVENHAAVDYALTTRRPPELKQSKVSPSTSRRTASAERKDKPPAERKDPHLAGRNKQHSTTENEQYPTERKDQPPVESDNSQLEVDGWSKEILAKSGLGQKDSSPDKTSRKKREAVEKWHSKVEPLLKSLEGVALDEREGEEKMMEVCDLLWKTLKDGGFLGRTAGEAGTKRRSVLLKSVFRLLSSKKPPLLVKLSKIILSMNVTGNNLLNVCKLVFSLSRDETNDELFIKEDIAGPLVELLATTDPLSHTEAMVYGLGAVKLMASNAELRAALKTMGVVSMLAECLRKCSQEDVPLTSTSSIIVQLVIALRNLSDSGNIYEDFISSGLLPLLSQAVSLHSQNSEVVFNTSRFLSKLSLQTHCCSSLSQCTTFISVVPKLLTTHIKNQDITVRLCFILGNLTSANASLSHELYHTHKLLPSIEKALNYHLETHKVTKENQPGAGREAETRSIDVLIKAVRLVANLCVHGTVSAHLANETPTLKSLLNILGQVSVQESEELVINTLVTFNNLSYYADLTSTDSSGLSTVTEELTTVIVGLLLVDSEEVLLECVRVLGNTSKQSMVREIMAANRVDELLVTLLDSKRVELVFSSCGVLVNLMADPQMREGLKNYQGVRKLIDVLSHFGRQDWELASLVCKIILNYSDGLTDPGAWLSEDEASGIFHLIEELLDPVTAFTAYMMEEEYEGVESEEDSYKGQSPESHSLWKSKFSPVAQKILQRLRPNSHY